MAFRIRFVGGVQDGETFIISEGRSLTMGRSPSNGVYVRDKNVSRVHAQIAVEGGECVVTDLQSTNGTFVNGKRITEAKLDLGAVIRVGMSNLQFEEFLDETPQDGTTALSAE